MPSSLRSLTSLQRLIVLYVVSPRRNGQHTATRSLAMHNKKPFDRWVANP